MAATAAELRHPRDEGNPRHLSRIGRITAFLLVSGVAAALFSGQAAAAPVPSSGFLNLCKQAGAGVSAGETFDFTIVLSGVTRTVTVAAGVCERLEIPREGSPLSKGYFKSHPSAVTRLIPGSAKLVVDAQELSAAQVQAILGPEANVSSQSSLLLNLTQQLLAADLNILRGVQPPAKVLQALADANAGIQITLGSAGQIQLATTLSATRASALVKTLTAFNEGKLKGPATPTSASLGIRESIPADLEVSSIGCDPSLACSNINLDGGSVDAQVASGTTTTVTYTNRSTLGTLRLCKTAGTGITAATPFTFSTPDGDREVAAGACIEMVLPEVNTLDSDGKYGVSEYGCGTDCLGGDDGFAVTSIVCVPATRCASVSESVGTARVGLVGGETTTVTFTNRSTRATLRLCKAAGAGIAAGSLFKFSTPVGDRIVQADGACLDLVLPEVNTLDSDGKYAVSEYGCGAGCLDGDFGHAVASIVCAPADRCSSISEFVGTVRVGLVGGSTTTVTFTNRSSRGTLRVCKAAGTGIAAGTMFTFKTPQGDKQVAAGACVDLVLPEVNTSDSDGRYGVFEVGCGANCFGGDQGFVVSSIVCAPADRCSSISESVGTARVGLVGGSTTTVTFTNRSSRGTLRLCKAAGTGIAPGTLFTFKTPLGDRQVAAGACDDLVLPEVNTSDSDGRYGVFEVGCGANCFGGDQGFVVSSIVCAPADRCSSISESVGTARVGLVGAETTTVTFTNQATP